MTFAQRFPFYMHPDTARALLAQSRAFAQVLRVRREARRILREHGFSDSACGELAAIQAPAPRTVPHVRLIVGGRK
jgi:muconolactone delta-isomerase